MQPDKVTIPYQMSEKMTHAVHWKWVQLCCLFESMSGLDGMRSCTCIIDHQKHCMLLLGGVEDADIYAIQASVTCGMFICIMAQRPDSSTIKLDKAMQAVLA